MAAVSSLGRAAGAEHPVEREAELTRALYEQYAAQIFRYCLHQLGSREEAEDAVQSTFLNAFRGIKRGVVPELESAWLFKIAHNVCLSRRRSAWRRGKIEAPADFEVVEELAPAPPRRADELIGLQDVLEQMPEQQRRAILLREWQGLSYREIGDELELSQAAVETLIFRARRSLAQGLEQPRTVQKRRRRLGAGLLGNLLSTAQSSLVGGGGAAAVKVAATVAVVSAGTVVATAPVRHPPKPHRPKAPSHAARAAAGPAAAPAPAPAAAVTPAAPAQQVVHRHRHSAAHPAAHSTTGPAATRIGPAATPGRGEAPPVKAAPTETAPPADTAPQPASAEPTPAGAPAEAPGAAPSGRWRHERTNGPAEAAGTTAVAPPWAGHGRHDHRNPPAAEAPPATTSTGDTTSSTPTWQNDPQQTAPAQPGSATDAVTGSAPSGDQPPPAGQGQDHGNGH